MYTREDTRRINVGSVAVGAGAPVSIQSMTCTDTRDVDATLAQIDSLYRAGCEIIRVAVPDQTAVDALPGILAKSPIPVIADIHFDYKLALGAIAAGIHGVRINPGNIGSTERVLEVADAAKSAGIPLRVGSNSGSLPKGLFEQKLAENKGDYNAAMAEAIVEGALQQCRILEECGFNDIKVSLKSSNVLITIDAYKRFAEQRNYPLHIGVTEAGSLAKGTVKSSVGIGALLLAGLGDTMRVSLTADPVEEVKVAISILESVGLRSPQPEIISCPTCGRTEVDLIGLAEKVENFVESIKADGHSVGLKKLAVMGCVVNGPGEAKECELGIAGGKGKVVLFKFGKPIGTYGEEEGLEVLKKEILALS